MPRRRNDVPTERFNVSLPSPAAERVRRLAEARRTSAPAVITSLVASTLLTEADDDSDEETRVQASPAFQRLLHENERLTTALADASRKLAEHRATPQADLRGVPRWAWPLNC